MVMNIIVNENKVHIIVKDSLLGLLVTGFDTGRERLIRIRLIRSST